MEKEFKEILKHSKEALESFEEKVEDIGEEMAEDAKAYWKELRGELKHVGSKLKYAYEETEGEAELKSRLLLMEAQEKVDMLKDDLDAFVGRVARKSEKELDILALKAHLAKMDTEDALEEREKEFSHLYAKSKVEAEKVVQKALHEINETFVKLTEIV
jgi:plasmid stabilization system protein ParE